jgi:uncharacterized protein (TIGR02246 family)
MTMNLTIKNIPCNLPYYAITLIAVPWGLIWFERGVVPYKDILLEGTRIMDNKEQETIIAETQAFAEVWSRGDAKAAASYYTEDGVRVGAFGDVQHGRLEIEAAYDKLLHQTMPGAKAKQERGTVRMLTPELAVWQGAIEIIPAGGAAALKGHVVQVMKKIQGRWLILEAHPKLFPPPPAGR